MEKRLTLKSLAGNTRARLTDPNLTGFEYLFV